MGPGNHEYFPHVETIKVPVEPHVSRYPLLENEIGEVILKSGNAVFTGALASMGFWGTMA